MQEEMGMAVTRGLSKTSRCLMGRATEGSGEVMKEWAVRRISKDVCWWKTSEI